MAAARTSLRESSIFWLALGGVMAALAALPLAVGAAQKEGSESLWSNGWFVLGIVMAALGMLAVWWALVLFLAHRHIQLCERQPLASSQPRNRVPLDDLGRYLEGINRTMEDHGFGVNSNPPEAETSVKTTTPLVDSTEGGSGGSWLFAGDGRTLVPPKTHKLELRAALRAVARELDTAIATYGEAKESGRLWNAWSNPRYSAWNKHRRLLAQSIPVRTFEVLEDAYLHVKRLGARRGGATLSGLVGRHKEAMVLSPSDKVDDALLAATAAQQVIRQLLDDS